MSEVIVTKRLAQLVAKQVGDSSLVVRSETFRGA
jgi:hypothetical protein